jgi:hypothetical protein
MWPMVDIPEPNLTPPRAESTLLTADADLTERKLPSRTKDRTVTLLAMFRLDTTETTLSVFCQVVSNTERLLPM